MDKKTSVLAVLAGVVLIVVIAIVASSMRRTATPQKGPVQETGKVSTSTRQAAPVNIIVPEVNSSSTTPVNIAVPQVAAESSRDAVNSPKYRVFDMKVEKGLFTPNTVIVNQGDTVRINLLAVDKEYEFTQPELGYNFPLPEGKSMPLAFSATSAGDFLFYCKNCGGPEKGPTGHIIVAPKK